MMALLSQSGAAGNRDTYCRRAARSGTGGFSAVGLHRRKPGSRCAHTEPLAALCLPHPPAAVCRALPFAIRLPFAARSGTDESIAGMSRRSVAPRWRLRAGSGGVFRFSCRFRARKGRNRMAALLPACGSQSRPATPGSRGRSRGRRIRPAPDGRRRRAERHRG